MQLEKFLFCEMARQEANGQATLVGLHSADLLVVQQERNAPQQFILPNLACVVALGGMDGVRSLRFQWTVRYGETEVINSPEQTIPLLPKPYCNVMVNFAPFPCVHGVGDYEFRLTVQPDNRVATTYSRKLRIVSETLPQGTAPRAH